MKKLFPKVFEIKITRVSFIGLFIVAFLACAGINGGINLMGLPKVVEIVILVLCSLYFGILVLIALLNLVGIVNVKEN